VYSKATKCAVGKETSTLPMEKGIVLEEREWKTKKEVVMFVECEGYEYKGTKTEENQGQEFISRKQLRNLWCRNCLEA